MPKVTGLYFLTRERHPEHYRKPYRTFYNSDTWDKLVYAVGRMNKTQDYLVSKVVSIHGEARPETNGFFFIHKHSGGHTKKRRYYGSDNLPALQELANKRWEEQGRCFLVAQVIAEVSKTSKQRRKGKNDWMCSHCGERNGSSRTECKRCTKVQS